MIARSAWFDAVLVLVATTVVSWPVGQLVDGTDWVWRMLAGLLGVAVSGTVARGLRAPAGLVLLVQAFAAWVVLGWVFVPGSLVLGVPMMESFEHAAALVRAGAETIRVETVPAPEVQGLSFIVAASMVAVGWAVDALAVTLRSPALAGMPLLLVLVFSASGTGDALHPRYFLAAAAVWLMLLARQSLGAVRAWSSRRRSSASGVAPDRDVHPTGGHGRWAVTLGVTGVVLAVVAAGSIPHMAPRAVLRGLGDAPVGNDGGLVHFTETLDLAADLRDRSQRPVLEYRAEDGRTTPLRVLATHRFADGSWRPVDGDDAPPSVPPDVVQRDDVEHEQHEITVMANGLAAPQVAVPYPLVEADFGDIEWQADERTGTVRISERPDSYSATFSEVSGRLPDSVGTGPVASDLEDDLLRVDPLSRDIVSSTVTRVLNAADDEVLSNQISVAREIQSYLRGPEFTYSLTLADPAPVDGPAEEEATPAGDPAGSPAEDLAGLDEDGSAGGSELTSPEEDPITHFLTTKTGYCTHFATAMVMMARAIGIPARLALGFLPGERQDDGSYTVVAADAHAWPELYISGLGWTRFEPTPAVRSGSAPVYLRSADFDDAAPAPDSSASPAGERPTEEPTTPDLDVTVSQSSWTDTVGRAAPTVGLVVLGVVLLLLLVPTAGRWRRSAARRRATDDAGRVEGEWQAFVLSLADLGLPAPRGATPRQVGAHYTQAAGLSGDTAEALDRVVARVENARYAPGGLARSGPDAGAGPVADDVGRILDHARSRLGRGQRFRLALWPTSGLDQLRILADKAGAALRSADPSRRPRRS
ncbi:DUF3488 and transglutaminase-like domain-containing protein [Georgenia halophila]|uniref:DUF3488 and transglutaminase-like domain-containing protein n=1 Tax=Georgenia halophila TaxID=620889 RepID=A0ABP8L8D0_9MICO